jgi:hypothetical protein
MIRIGFASAMAACVLAGCATGVARDRGPAIVIEDVALFYRIYDAAGGRPSAESLQRDYIDAGSNGLRTLARLRNVTGARMAENIENRPEAYVNARACAATLPRVQRRLASALGNLNEIYPQMRTPDVTIVVGRGRPVGVGSPLTGVQIGLEALCGADFLNPNLEDRFVYVIAHEFAHVEQAPELAERDDLTVLEMSLLEGAAEFVGELISGDVSYSHLRRRVAGRELEIETAFAADMDSRDLTNWLYNTGAHADPDLGYWVGYRIAKAYYRNAADKRQAVREILEMTDAHAFLAASGWRPGIDLR